MRWLKEYWPEAVPVLVLLAWKSRGLPGDLLLTLPLLAVGLTVLVVGLRYVRQYQRPVTTALWVMALVILVTGSITPILVDLHLPLGSWPWFLSVILGLAAWPLVAWLSGRLARHGLSFAFLLCAAYLAYSHTSFMIPADALAITVASIAVGAAITIVVLTHRFPILSDQARRRGIILLLAFPLANALLWSLTFMISLESEPAGDRLLTAASFIVPYIVIALVLLGATRLVARRYLPAKPQYSD